jgi:SAM-dependent methyltransferase
MHDSERHESNRRAWNEAAAKYASEIDADVAFLRGGGTNFRPPEREVLPALVRDCARAIHLQCAGGTDTLSLWNLGAREVIGVDISDDMLACARAKSDALAAPARWVRCDVLETPHDLDGTADLVYTGRGALCWMMDLAAWARVAARLLAPGGALFVFEGHPLSWVWDQAADHYKLDPVYGDYFDGQVHEEAGWPETYIPATCRPARGYATKFERQHTLGDIVNAVLGAGLTLERLGEHRDRYWVSMPAMPAAELDRLPHTFSLLARRPARATAPGT